jgi:hypothetical protein
VAKGDVDSEIQEAELQVMRAWLAQDRSALKSLLHRDFTLMVGTLPPEVLDRPSFTEAAQNGLILRAFSLRAMLVRPYKQMVWCSTGGELEIEIGRTTWRGEFLITDLWQRGLFGRGWKLAERSLARIEPDDRLSNAVRRLQLWH